MSEITNKIARLKGYVRINERNRWVWAVPVTDDEFPDCLKPVYTTQWDSKIEAAKEAILTFSKTSHVAEDLGLG